MTEEARRKVELINFVNVKRRYDVAQELCSELNGLSVAEELLEDVTREYNRAKKRLLDAYGQ